MSKPSIGVKSMPIEKLSAVSDTRAGLPDLHDVMKPEKEVNRSSTLLSPQPSGAFS